ncbi:MAG TPA: dienelactone hydrolase family protein, partial [Isosphaeraceae bacterium]|nr:dienelactone hydrolase family protein [Isosphaeraceae bacterium]
MRRHSAFPRFEFLFGLLFLVSHASRALAQKSGPPLPGTKPLTMSGDIASELVAGVDRFLLRQIDESTARRASYWKRDFSSEAAYRASVEPNRKRLAHILGVRDERVQSSRMSSPTWMFGPNAPIDLDPSAEFMIQPVSWSAFGDVTGEGLEIGPGPRRRALANIIVIPDADQTVEQLAGLAPGVAPESRVVQRLVANGCRVIVPALIDRTIEPRNGRAKLTYREFIYRSAFELGRHIIGYEVQKVLALVDLLSRQQSAGTRRKIAIFGYGEGGAIALYAAALDPRIDAVCVSGYFGDRNDIWRQPADRNVFGLLEQFGDAEVASLVAPRTLIVEAAKGPEVVIPPGTGGAPGRLTTLELQTVKAEVEKARQLVAGLGPKTHVELVVSGPDGTGPFGTGDALRALVEAIDPGSRFEPARSPARVSPRIAAFNALAAARDRPARQLHELDRHNQQLLVESADVRREFMKKLDTSSSEAYARTVEPYRDFFADEVVGRFDLKLLPPNVRSRQIYDEPRFTGYEVVMDVFPDVIASGILLLPKGIAEGEKRPVVVCQHGLEGRPSDLADPKVENPAYHKFAVRLAERGFITFAPQNLYIFHDRFRTLQRKANPIKKTLFSVIVPQHQQITEWLKTLPNVDPARIAFYGLSYGGKSAMRIPPLVKNYCLSICSADFNEWVWKTVSIDRPFTYPFTIEYDMYEFDFGSTFNYGELAELMAPRPFMVERG